MGPSWLVVRGAGTEHACCPMLHDARGGVHGGAAYMPMALLTRCARVRAEAGGSLRCAPPGLTRLSGKYVLRARGRLFRCLICARAAVSG